MFWQLLDENVLIGPNAFWAHSSMTLRLNGS